MRVLLVENDPDTAELLGELLGPRLGELVTVPGAAEAVQVHLLFDFDLIIMDARLGDLEEESLPAALRRWSRVPLIVLVDQGEEAAALRYVDDGADCYLFKPSNVRQLRMVAHALYRRSLFELG